MIAWMAYATVVSGLFSLAALALERGVEAYGGPRRWVWGGAMALSLVVPAGVWLAPSAVAGDVVSGSAAVTRGVVALEPIIAVAGEAPPAVERLVGAGWGAASAVLFAIVVGSAWTLARRRRAWRRGTVAGVPVLVSAGTGPAVVGAIRGTIVVPEWVAGLRGEWQELLLRHEREHRRAGDPALLAAAFALLVVAPWNAALWWQMRRLRLAVEIDCDARVLRDRPDARAYGSLLLEVGRRVPGSSPVGAAFLEPRTFLERRIDTMTRDARQHRRLRGTGYAALAVLVGVLACEAPTPEEISDDGEDAAAVATADRLAESGPTFTPYTRAPELTNPDEAIAALERLYPPVLREAGIKGTALVWFLIGEDGRVVDTRLKEGTGRESLDMAALEAARQFRFTPAQQEGDPVPVWVAIPITFSTDWRSSGSRRSG